MNTKKLFLLFTFYLTMVLAIQAQNIGINKTGVKPDNSAVLDLNTGNNGTLGFLPPQVALTATNVAAPVTLPATGLIVYNTNTAGTTPTNVIPGYYYWNGTEWIAFTAGASSGGTTGPTGPAGVDGSTGPTGAAGTDGATGPTGVAGIDGATGDAGAAGATGSNGATGPTGVAGADGVTGPTGVAGTNGATGPTGLAGTDGVTGPTGVAGAAGANGITGPTGVAGNDGATGPTGIAGAIGPTGIAGAAGATGATGTNGAAGPTGATGTNGVTGPTGVAGATGSTGPSWTLSSISADSTTGFITVTGTTGSGGPITTKDGAWLLRGNVADTNKFIGTTNNVPFFIKVNDTIAGKIDNTYNNVFLGYQTSGLSNPSNTNNTAIGSLALQSLTVGSANTALGFKALNSVKASNNNVAIGASALLNVVTVAGGKNTAVGYWASKATTAEGNVSVGFEALLANKTGTYNTAIGYEANVSTAALKNATAIGDSAKVTQSYSMELGDSAVLFTGINGALYSSTKALVIGTSSKNGNGAYLTVGGVWSVPSDRNKKENFTVPDYEIILTKIDSLPVLRWNYKGEDPSIQHIGPMAQDFYAAFHVGTDNISISTIDPAGVALIGVKALDKKLAAADKKTADSLSAIKAENAVLKQQIDQLQTQISAMQSAQALYQKQLEELKELMKEQSGAKK